MRPGVYGAAERIVARWVERCKAARRAEMVDRSSRPLPRRASRSKAVEAARDRFASCQTGRPNLKPPDVMVVVPHRVGHHHQLADEALGHEIGLRAVKIRELVDAADNRPNLALLDIANETAEIRPRALG